MEVLWSFIIGLFLGVFGLFWAFFYGTKQRDDPTGIGSSGERSERAEELAEQLKATERETTERINRINGELQENDRVLERAEEVIERTTARVRALKDLLRENQTGKPNP